VNEEQRDEILMGLQVGVAAIRKEIELLPNKYMTKDEAQTTRRWTLSFLVGAVIAVEAAVAMWPGA